MVLSSIYTFLFDNLSNFVLISTLLLAGWISFDFVSGYVMYQFNCNLWNSYQDPNFTNLYDFNPYHFLVFNLNNRIKNLAGIIFVFSVLCLVVLISCFHTSSSQINFQHLYGNNAFQINFSNLNFFWLFGVTFSMVLYINISMWTIKQQGPILIKQFIFLPSLLGLLYLSLAWLLFANDLLLVALLLVSFSILSYTIFMILPSRLVIEATIKYYALSAVSLILFILGSVLLFSITGSCDLLIIKNKFLLSQTDAFLFENIVLRLAFLGIFSGLLFKLGAAPFHAWVADVYEAIDIDFVALFAIPVKIALFGYLYNLTVIHFYPLFSAWHIWFWAVSVLCVVIGCFGALRQKKILRFYAYTAINQMGFLLFSILVTVRLFNDTFSIYVNDIWLSLFSLNAVNVVWYYLVIYMLLSLLFFLFYSYTVRPVSTYINGKVIDSHLLQMTHIFHFTKLKYIFTLCLPTQFTMSGFVLGGLIIIFFSMSGLPPFPLFYGKFQLFYQMLLCNYVSTVFFLLCLSIVSTFYYLRVINSLLFQKNKFYELIIQYSSFLYNY